MPLRGVLSDSMNPWTGFDGPMSRGALAAIDRSTATSRRSTQRRVWWRRAFKSLSLPALGMGVMLFAGSIAVSSAGKGTLRSELPPLPSSPLVFPPSLSRPVALSSAERRTKPAPAEIASLATAPSSEQTWVVQVAALASQARSTTMVQHLTDLGWPAYQVDPDGTTHGLTIVRVGPYRTAGEADDARARLCATPDYEGAFIRNITIP
jgi:cell division septation protein DedD